MKAALEQPPVRELAIPVQAEEAYDSTGCGCSFTTAEGQMLKDDDKRPRQSKRS
jgi:hypothetical protein